MSLPLNVNDEVRDATFRTSMLASTLSGSSEIPSAKKPASASVLMLTKGGTAIDASEEPGAASISVAGGSSAVSALWPEIDSDPSFSAHLYPKVSDWQASPQTHCQRSGPLRPPGNSRPNCDSPELTRPAFPHSSVWRSRPCFAVRSSAG